MAWSKTTRISVMLVIDMVFFLVELISGFLVGSLALTADAFHMLNDIISLLVGLWAVIVARKATTDRYSYGWLRAEILGAFFNAVFLIALCVSIILEALVRFVNPLEIGNAELILIVGSLGLASNLAGFLVLGGHGHSHEPGEHSHEDRHRNPHDHAHDDLSAAEAGLARESDIADESGRVADILPHSAVVRFGHSVHPDASRHIRFDESDDQSGYKISGQSRGRNGRRAGSIKRGRLTSIDDISIHPASFRQEIIAASQSRAEDETASESGEDEYAVVGQEDEAPLIRKHVLNGASSPGYGTRSISRRSKRCRRDSGTHNDHNHSKPKKPGKKSHHSHGDMGMNSMILHVLGDALGNVGVIVTALVIKFTTWPGRFYADPAVSLFITLIILRSAIPLTIAASRILLQATPDSIDLQDVKEDIQALPGVISCHHVHIWQLSDTRIVASMHIQVTFPISKEGGERYMTLSKAARKCLHAYGIHSATIQPEFYLDPDHQHIENVRARADVDQAVAGCGIGENNVCLLDCIDECSGQGCCNQTEFTKSNPSSMHSLSEHDHDHDHDYGH